MHKKKGINFQEANRIAADTIRDWLPEISRGKPSGDWINNFPNPTRPDRDPASFGVNPRAGIYHDFTGETHDLLHLFAIVHGLSDGDAAKTLLPQEVEPYEIDITRLKESLEKQRAQTVPGQWDHVHPYTDGVTSFFVCRRDARGDTPKEILQATEIDGKVVFKKPAKPPHGYPLLNLDKILSAPEDATIVLVEGEVKSEAIPEPYIATSVAGGANAWRDADLSPLADKKNVILWPDNDEPGKKCMAEISARLPHARVVTPSPDWPKGADVANFPYEERVAILAGAQKPIRREPFPLHSFENIPLEPPKWLVKGILEDNSFSCFFGASGTGKSYTVLSMACCIATGKPFFGHAIKTTGPIIYVAGEGFAGIAKRLFAWEKYHDTKIPPETIFVSGCPAALGDDDFMQHVTEAVARVAEAHGRPALIIIDTWARNMTGNENDTADTSAAIRSLDQLRMDYRCAAIVVHHTGKADSERARGSSALRAALDTEYQVDNTKDIVTVRNTKMKDGESPDPMVFSFEYVDLGITDDDGEPVFSSVITPVAEGLLTMKNPIETKKSEDAAIKILMKHPEGMPIREFHAEMKNCGMSQKTVKRTKDSLEAAGQVLISGMKIMLKPEETVEKTPEKTDIF